MPGQQLPARLLGDAALHASSVVANNAMNRERQLAGVNSYQRELGFSPLDFLAATVAASGTGSWLDLCCGTGRALIQAAATLADDGLARRTMLVGVDLVDAFAATPASLSNLRLVCSPVDAWTPDRDFGLITCVHGLHYVGDKLTALTCAARWLAPSGRLIADLDLNEIIVPRGPRALARVLRTAGFSYDSRRRRISRVGPLDASLPYRYLGADDQAGPGYTGQPSVASYYEDRDDFGGARTSHWCAD
ncbi:MAG TPA: methyltransferase domain-containing protein [Trebonia sp.]|nr:methyltransferase domain-containing protein [Trebonia sp.]